MATPNTGRKTSRVSTPRTAAETTDKRVTKKGLEIGDTGTKIFDGIITEEYNTKLQDIKGVRVFDEMRKSDGTVQAAVKACTLPIRSARWFVEAASEDQADKDIAEFVEHCFFDYMSITFNDLMRHATLSLPLGVMAFEKVFETRDCDGQMRIVWAKLAPRLPQSVQKWAIAGGELGITQRTSDGDPVEIPIEKLVVIVNEQEGSNWWGTSILRAAYKHWFIKNTIYKIDAIAHERQGLGVPYVKLPEQYSATDQARAEEILKNIRANHQAFIIEPFGYEIGFKDMMAKGTRDPSSSIAHHNREIMKSVLAQFIELGASEGGSGSRAVSQDHSDLFMQSLITTARGIADGFNKYAIPQLVDLNFDNVDDYPKLNFAGIDEADAKGLADTYKVLIDAGALKPSDQDEQYLRELLKLPERDQTEDPITKDPNAEPVVPPVDPNAKDAEVDPNNPEPPVDNKKEASEPRQVRYPLKKKITAAEQGDVKPWRALTFAEQKVDFNSIQRMMDSLEEDFDTVTGDLLHTALDEFMAAFTKAAHAGDLAGIKAATIKAQAEYAKIIKNASKTAFDFGKNNAAKELGVSAKATPAEILQQIDIQANAIAAAQISQMVNDAKGAYVQALNKGLSITAALAAADEYAAAAIDSLTADTSTILMSGYMNHGRDETFDNEVANIYALQRSEILDRATCNYCLSIDGRVVEQKDPYAQNTIFHSGCRGIWVAIMLDEQELPSIGGIPKGLRDRFGDAVNDLIQPKTPQTTKTSLARKEVERRQRGKAK